MDAYETAFHHEALFYAGDDEFLAGTVPFVHEAMRRDEQVLVVLGEENTALLKRGLGDAAAGVTFVPMEVLGRNPARIIPAWRDFVGAWANGRPVRGIGEPIWPGRSAEELVECHHHESLLNLAFADGAPWWLLCPYDADRLEPEVLEAARRTHPTVREGGISDVSSVYLEPTAVPGPFVGPLTPSPAEHEEVVFSSAAELGAMRALVAKQAMAAGLEEERIADFVLAVHELANNSVRHVGGEALLRIWTEPKALVAEVRDTGRIEGPLTGRERPLPEQLRGRGLWIVNQLCDLVQIRALPSGNVFRIRMNLAA